MILTRNRKVFIPRTPSRFRQRGLLTLTGAGLSPWSISGASTDPYWSSVQLLAINDNKADTTTAFADQSSIARTLTANGNAQYDSATAPTGMTTSGLFDGTGDFVSAASSADFAYGTGDFTWETWIYGTSASWTTGNFYISDHGSNGGVLFYFQNILRYYNVTTGISSTLYTGGGSIAASTWTHVGVSRVSGTTYLAKAGTVVASAADTHNYGSQAFRIGDYGGGAIGFVGNIGPYRLTKGVGRWTASFTPPTPPLPTS